MHLSLDVSNNISLGYQLILESEHVLVVPYTINGVNNGSLYYHLALRCPVLITDFPNVLEAIKILSRINNIIKTKSKY